MLFPKLTVLGAVHGYRFFFMLSYSLALSLQRFNQRLQLI